MYNLKYVRKVVETYLNSSHAPREMLSILDKTPQDLMFLFQNSQLGWRFFKKITKSKLFRQALEVPEYLNIQAVIDWAADLFFETFYTVDGGEYRAGIEETLYLTKFFSRIITEGAPK